MPVRQRIECPPRLNENGATLLEYAVFAAIIVLILSVAVPRLEVQVKSRIDAGGDMWTTWDMGLPETP